jgi:hypothetical protein
MEPQWRQISAPHKLQHSFMYYELPTTANLIYYVVFGYVLTYAHLAIPPATAAPRIAPGVCHRTEACERSRMSRHGSTCLSNKHETPIARPVQKSSMHSATFLSLSMQRAHPDLCATQPTLCRHTSRAWRLQCYREEEEMGTPSE